MQECSVVRGTKTILTNSLVKYFIYPISNVIMKLILLFELIKLESALTRHKHNTRTNNFLKLDT